MIPFKEEFGFYRDDVVSTISEFVFRAYAFQLDFVYVEVFMLRKLIVYVIVHNRSSFLGLKKSLVQSHRKNAFVCSIARYYSTSTLKF